jgi:hypothetical protein
MEMAMPILPIVDLMILMAWTSLLGAFVLKAIRLTTSYHPSLFGLGPMEMTLLAAVLLLFALTLTARTWLKERESAGSSARDRAADTLQAYSAVRSASLPGSEGGREELADGGSPRASAPAKEGASGFVAAASERAMRGSSFRV